MSPTPVFWAGVLAVAWLVVAAVLGPLLGRYLAWRDRNTRHGIAHPPANRAARKAFRRRQRAARARLRAMDAEHRDRMERHAATRRRLRSAGHDPDLAGDAPEFTPLTDAMTLPRWTTKETT